MRKSFPATQTTPLNTYLHTWTNPIKIYINYILILSTMMVSPQNCYGLYTNDPNGSDFLSLVSKPWYDFSWCQVVSISWNC